MKSYLASGYFGFLNVVRVCSLAAGVLTASACQSESKMLSAPVTGYNHTSAAINRFSVNGAGGPNLGPHEGGGSEVCCGVVPRYWVPGLRAVVEWEKDPDPDGYIKRDQYGQFDDVDYERHAANYSRHKAVVDIPRYDTVGVLKVHFLPCDQVRVSAENIRRDDPGYSYNYPLTMEEPKVCLK
ncbi:DUF3304 domain-containing protein [Pseudomonas sp. TKO26]|nr:DUF3304 domain-containing protein [Pseudomonas sp. TKO30]PYY84694.1 DUF3304 domain-containing protein [Pseudomonas sp. TKO29]PYY86992.1 DUF3304 domain-containing protein [Pseudomonas sp. TKO26]PYY98359.1 DUF3304 domain-containing protein [Pseudomonas sp. TKO14]QTU10209.1 DUF3304 domain-containing protein [Pseudomonas protegens]